MSLSKLIADAVDQADKEGRLVEVDVSVSVNPPIDTPIDTPVAYRPLMIMSSKKGPLPLIHFTKKDLS